MKFNPTLSPIVIALGLVSNPSLANINNETATPVERIQITGSRILREEVVSYAPITIFNADDISQIGVTSVDTLLQRISASAGFAGNQTNAYWTSGGYGSSQVNLRGLGINRTLVLLNGRRMLNSGTGANASVDLNTIPVSTIERIEILKDGASAIYGADAVAGVVNIITKNNIDGIELSARAGQTGHGDGEEINFDITLGKVWDQGSGYVAMSYDKTKAVSMTSRAPCPLKEVDGELVCGGSSKIPEGIGYFLDENGQATGEPMMLTPDGSTPYTSENALNYFEYFNAVQPIERFNLFSAAEYDIKEDVNVFIEAMFTTRTSNLPATPQTISNVVIPSWHSSNPTDQDFLLNSRRIGEAPRDFEVNSETWRIVTGAKGSFSQNWDWDMALNFGRNTGDFQVTNVIDKTRLAQATNYELCSQNDSIPCANLWGEGSLTDEMLEYFLIDTFDEGGNEQFSFTASVTGELFALPAGMVTMAAGIEHRKEQGWYTPDAATISGEAMTAQQDPIDGEYSANEVYAEVNIPLISDHKYTDRLELSAALRYSDFDTFGDDTNYKLGLQWQFNEQWMFRTTRSTAFRVPNIPELFGGISQGYMNTTDPCSTWTTLDSSSNRYKNCQASGIPESYVQEGTILTDRGGNPDLQPEEADTFTLGMVWQVASLSGLSFTVDYYDIEIENAINSVNGSSKLAACYDSSNMSHPFCSENDFIRDPVTGEITYLQTQLGNAASEKLSGIDLGAFLIRDFNGFATSTKLELSYLDEYSIQTFKDAPIKHKEGTIRYDGSYTQWRGNLYFNLAKDEWNASYNVQFIGNADDQYANSGDIGDSVGSVIYHNIQMSYQLNAETEIYDGVDNIFDKQAPYQQSYTDGNTNTMTYDLQGRRFYIGVNYKI